MLALQNFYLLVLKIYLKNIHNLIKFLMVFSLIILKLTLCKL